MFAKPFQDQLVPAQAIESKSIIDAAALTDVCAARAWALSLLDGMSKPDAETMQASRSNPKHVYGY